MPPIGTYPASSIGCAAAQERSGYKAAALAAMRRASRRESMLSPMERTLLDAFNDSEVALHGITQYVERSLISPAVERAHRLFEGLEFDDDRAFFDSGAMGERRNASNQEASSAIGDRWCCEARVGRQPLRVIDLAISGAPVSLGHAMFLRFMLCSIVY